VFASGTTVTVRQKPTIVPAIKTHFETIHRITAIHGVVTQLPRISPQIKVQAVFTSAQTGTVDAILTVFDNVRIFAALGKHDVIARTDLASDNIPVFVNVGSA